MREYEVNDDLSDCQHQKPAPDIAIEWTDVEIEIKYCGAHGTDKEDNYMRSILNQSDCVLICIL